MQHKELWGWKATVGSHVTRLLVLFIAFGWIGVQEAWAQGRVVSAVGPSIGAGQNGTVTVSIQAQGNENAVGFSLTFDPARLTYVSTVRGADATGTSLQVNASQAASGRIGVALSLDTEVTFPAGARQLIIMTFTAKTGAGSGATSIGFGDTPVTSEVADALASKVTATFTGGTVTVLNTAPNISDVANQTINEDSSTAGLAFTVGDLETPPASLIIAVTSSNTDLVPETPANLTLGGSGADRTLTVTPAANKNGTATITLMVSDGAGGLTASDTFVLTVTAVNDAPSFTKGADVTVLEDAAAFSAVWATAISPGPPDEATQTLTFSVSNNNSALFATPPGISAAGTLSFTPAPNVTGAATVTVTLQDSGGTANSGLDTSAEQTFTINVTAVNDPPSFTKGTDVTVLEDSAAATFTGWATAMSKGPEDEASQTLSFQVSNNNNPLFSVQPAVASDGTLTFTPAANVAGTTTVTVALQDNGGTANGGSDTSAAQTFTISVTAVNDAPSFIKGTDVVVPEDSGAQTVTGWATSISPGPADEAGQSVSFQLSNNNSALFSVPPAIAANGTLTFTPAANATGTADVTVSLQDNGGTSNGGSDTSAAQTFQITLNGINDPPTISDIANTSTRIDTPKTVNFTVGDVESDPGSLTVTAVSSNPLVVLDSGIATGGTGANRSLVITPVAAALGTTTITVTVSDGTDTATDTFVLEVNLNAVPTITLLADQTINEDGSVGALGFTVADTDGTVGAPTVTSDNPTLLPPGSLVLAGSGANWTLAITPAANEHGTATVTVSVTDNEAALGTETLLLTVNAVNDRPSFTKGADIILNEDAGAQTRSGWATAISVGPLQEASQTAAFEVSNSNNPLFSVQPTIAPNGTLSFTPAANAFGTATVTVALQDNGGTANGGLDLSVVQTFAITLNSVNDAPSFTAGANITLTEDAGVQTRPGWATGMSAGPANESTQQLTFQLSNNNPSLFSVQPTLSPDGMLSFTPAANAFGVATVGVVLRDNGGTANGGVDASPSQALTITIDGVNDAPVFAGLTPPVTSKNRAVEMAFTVSDVETPATDLSVTVTCSDSTLVSPAGLVLSHTGGSYVLRITPEPDQFRTADLTFTVTDGESLATTEVILLTVNENNPPAISSIGNQTTAEDTPTAALAFTVGDVETAAGSLTVERTTSNATLLPLSGIVLGGSGANRTVRLTPAANQSGSALVTLTVKDSENAATAMSFTLNVTAVNDAPTLAEVDDKTTREDTPLDVALTVGDVDHPLAGLTFTVRSSDESVVPNSSNHLTVTGTGAARNLRISPASNKFGTTDITVEVSDGSLTDLIAFAVTVTPVNDAPRIEAIPNTSVAEGSIMVMGVVVTDVDDPATSLKLSARLLPSEPVQAGSVGFGAGSEPSVLYFPPAGTFGRAAIEVTVTDGRLSSSTSFVVTIVAQNAPPTISSIADLTVDVGTAIPPIGFQVSDRETPASGLDVEVSASNSVLLPAGSLTLGGTDRDRTLTVTPAMGMSGTSEVILRVSDSEGAVSEERFLLGLRPVSSGGGEPGGGTGTEPGPNVAPEITPIAAQTVAENGVLGPLAFLVVDDDSRPELVEVTASASDPVLLPTLVLGGERYERSLIVRPGTGLTGVSTVTLTARDQAGGTARTTFQVTVVRGNKPPILSDIAPQTTKAGLAVTVEFTVSDEETPSDLLAVSASTSNPTLVGPGALVFGGSGSNRRMTIQPTAGATGTVTITVTVRDGGLAEASDSFVVTVTGEEPAASWRAYFEHRDHYLALWEMDGPRAVRDPAGTFLDPMFAPAGWSARAAGDLDGDGRTDLVFQTEDGTVGVWLMDGAVLLASRVAEPPAPMSPVWKVVATADFNGDLSADLIFQREDGVLAVWYMRGAAVIGSALLNTTVPLDAGWRVAGAAARPGGVTDLILQHEGGSLGAWTMLGVDQVGADFISPLAPAEATARCVAVTDVDRDGQADLIFRSADSTLEVWTMDGFSRRSTVLLTPAQCGVDWNVFGPR